MIIYWQITESETDRLIYQLVYRDILLKLIILIKILNLEFMKKKKFTIHTK
jgi:hypothetical protein